MSRNHHLCRIVVSGLLVLFPLVSYAQQRWQVGPGVAFLFRQFRSNDAGGVFKPRFNAVTGIGGLRISRYLNRYDVWAETGVSYTPLDVIIAETNERGYSGYGNGSGLWIIPTLVRKDIKLRLPGTYFGPNQTLRFSFNAGIQHQFLANKSSSGSFSSSRPGLNYIACSTAQHTYNPALFVESAIRLLLIRRRLDALIRINATLGLRELIRTDIRYTTSTNATPQLATVTYSGSGKGWGISLRYLIY